MSLSESEKIDEPYYDALKASDKAWVQGDFDVSQLAEYLGEFAVGAINRTLISSYDWLRAPFLRSPYFFSGNGGGTKQRKSGMAISSCRYLLGNQIKKAPA